MPLPSPDQQRQTAIMLSVRINVLHLSSFAFSYIGGVTARHASSGRQPNFAAWYKRALILL